MTLKDSDTPTILQFEDCTSRLRDITQELGTLRGQLQRHLSHIASLPKGDQPQAIKECWENAISRYLLSLEAHDLLTVAQSDLFPGVYALVESLKKVIEQATADTLEQTVTETIEKFRQQNEEFNRRPQGPTLAIQQLQREGLDYLRQAAHRVFCENEAQRKKILATIDGVAETHSPTLPSLTDKEIEALADKVPLLGRYRLYAGAKMRLEYSAGYHLVSWPLSDKLQTLGGAILGHYQKMVTQLTHLGRLKGEKGEKYGDKYLSFRSHLGQMMNEAVECHATALTLLIFQHRSGLSATLAIAERALKLFSLLQDPRYSPYLDALEALLALLETPSVENYCLAAHFHASLPEIAEPKEDSPVPPLPDFLQELFFQLAPVIEPLLSQQSSLLDLTEEEKKVWDMIIGKSSPLNQTLVTSCIVKTMAEVGNSFNLQLELALYVLRTDPEPNSASLWESLNGELTRLHLSYKNHLSDEQLKEATFLFFRIEQAKKKDSLAYADATQRYFQFHTRFMNPLGGPTLPLLAVWGLAYTKFSLVSMRQNYPAAPSEMGLARNGVVLALSEFNDTCTMDSPISQLRGLLWRALSEFLYGNQDSFAGEIVDHLISSDKIEAIIEGSTFDMMQLICLYIEYKVSHAPESLVDNEFKLIRAHSLIPIVRPPLEEVIEPLTMARRLHSLATFPKIISEAPTYQKPTLGALLELAIVRFSSYSQKNGYPTDRNSFRELVPLSTFKYHIPPFPQDHKWEIWRAATYCLYGDKDPEFSEAQRVYAHYLGKAEFLEEIKNEEKILRTVKQIIYENVTMGKGTLLANELTILTELFGF